MNDFKQESGGYDFNRSIEELGKNICAQGSKVADNMELFFHNKPKYVILLSFCDGIERAYVVKGIGNSVETSWKNAVDSMKKKIKTLNLNPIWLKADIVNEIHEYDYSSFIDYVSDIKINYFRQGIAFDNMFNVAFLEQEVNANTFIRESKDANPKKKELIWKNINFYLNRSTGRKYQFDERSVGKVFTFSTIGFFHDGDQCHRLCTDGLDVGRRYIESIDKELILSIIIKSSNFLAEQINSEGRFRYGYFPCFDQEIPHYNILRHASSTYSMIEAYEFNNDPNLGIKIKSALEYLINEGSGFFESNEGIKMAFVIEKLPTGLEEIKLGANAAAILALAKYTKVFDDTKFVPVMKALAEGIRFFQNKDDGSFVHVLNYPDLSVKDRHRVIYYDGEAAFALMRLYDIDKDEKWIQTVEKAFSYFLKNNYWKHSDHWLSYCSFELMKYKPDKQYVLFNLQNASGILDFCLTRETTYPTLLELLMATYSMIEKLKAENIFLETLESFDYSKFVEAIEHRVAHQLNGLYFPEVAMYYKAPGKILYSFYIRHHSFRSRIDDNEHNISGYCSYLFNRLKAAKAL